MSAHDMPIRYRTFYTQYDTYCVSYDTDNYFTHNTILFLASLVLKKKHYFVFIFVFVFIGK